jgi:ribosomal protein S18 acetylase RimI-like enzyme
VLNPLWESAEELDAEFARFGIRPEEHVLVADEGDEGEVQGMVGFLRRPGDSSAGMLCPIVRRKDRGRGIGGELLRAAQRLAAGRSASSSRPRASALATARVIRCSRATASGPCARRT